MSGWTITIEDVDGEQYCVAKLLRTSNGYSLGVPYHPASDATLFRFPIEYSNRADAVANHELDLFNVQSRVKLSIHRDFVQFSSMDWNNVISGIDPESSRPRGLGLVSPEHLQIESGPIFGVLLWGLHDFQPRAGRTRDVAAVLQSEVYDGPCMLIGGPSAFERRDAYMIEFFQFDDQIPEAIREVDGKRVLTKLLPYNETLYTIIFRHELRVFEHADAGFSLGMVVSRTSCGFESESGYALSSPGCWDEEAQQFFGIQAIAPLQAYMGAGRSLDYEPGASP